MHAYMQVNGDQKISFDEFVRLFRQAPSKHASVRRL